MSPNKLAGANFVIMAHGWNGWYGSLSVLLTSWVGKGFSASVSIAVHLQCSDDLLDLLDAGHGL